MYQVKHFHITEVYNIKEGIIFLILNHIAYIIFSYIIEFLSFIYYIELLPNDFIIRKDSNINEIIHRVILILNSIFIIIYNFNNFFFISLVNRPMADKSYHFKMKISNSKLIILIAFQNFSLLHPIQFYLNDNTNRIWCILYSTIIILVLLWLYFISFKSFDYDNILNSLLSFIGEFCFVSIVIEILLFLFSMEYNNYKELLLYTIAKIIISLCLFICLRKIYLKKMMKIIHKRLFYNNPYNYPFDVNLINSVLFLRELFENKNEKYLSKIQDFIITHQKNCINYNCACKLLIIKNNKNEVEHISFTDELNKNLNYFIESLLINFNFQNDYTLAILLSEHFNLYKNNPLMSYSILQTLLHYNHKNLSKKESCYFHQ